MWRSVLFVLVLGFVASAQAQKQSADAGWPTYGGDAGGQRYSAADQITPQNVAGLRKVWEFHTGALGRTGPSRTEAAFEATPVLHNGVLYFSTPFDQVVAVDAKSGSPKWRYDPQVPTNFLAGVYTSRGVAFWGEPAVGTPCAARVFIATLDGRLLALDAVSGTPCRSFGESGTVDLEKEPRHADE